MLQSNTLKDRLKCKIEFSEEEELPQIVSLSSVDDAIRFEDRYEALQILGQGAHAVVKLAKKRETHEQFAVKITRMNNEEIYNNVKRTFNNARCLRHQNLIQEIELFINEKYQTACLVMEYCSYPSLEKVLKERGTLEEDEIRAILKQLLLGIQHMHSKGISHRDIKPDNILVNINGECEVKLLDFGVSRRFIIKNQHIDMLTKTGNILYCAPEIYHQSHYSKEVDVWSAGIIMYQCLTGELPIHYDNISQQIEILGQPQLWNFKTKLQNSSLSAQNLISRLLQFDPKKRITSSDALNHPFIQKNQIYSTMAMLSSKNVIDEDENINKCKSLQTSLTVNQKSSLHRALKTLHLGEEYQDIVIEDLITELGNIHVVQRNKSAKYSGFIELMNSLGNSQGVAINKILDNTQIVKCNLGIGSAESIVTDNQQANDMFGDLGIVQSSVEFGNLGSLPQSDQKKNPLFYNHLNQLGGKIACSIDMNVNLTDSIQEGAVKTNQFQLLSTLDVLGIKECDETVEDVK